MKNQWFSCHHLYNGSLERIISPWGLCLKKKTASDRRQGHWKLMALSQTWLFKIRTLGIRNIPEQHIKCTQILRVVRMVISPLIEKAENVMASGCSADPHRRVWVGMKWTTRHTCSSWAPVAARVVVRHAKWNKLPITAITKLGNFTLHFVSAERRGLSTSV